MVSWMELQSRWQSFFCLIWQLTNQHPVRGIEGWRSLCLRWWQISETPDWLLHSEACKLQWPSCFSATAQLANESHSRICRWPLLPCQVVQLKWGRSSFSVSDVCAFGENVQQMQMSRRFCCHRWQQKSSSTFWQTSVWSCGLYVCTKEQMDLSYGSD